MRLVFVLAVFGFSLAASACVEGDRTRDVGATARSRTVAAIATEGADQVTTAQRVRDELTDAIGRARSFQSGLMLLRLQISGSALSEAAERSAQESVLTACDGWPRELNLEIWPLEFRDPYTATTTGCAAVQTVLAALREGAGAAAVSANWQSVVTELTVSSGFDISLGTMLARLPHLSQEELLRAIRAMQ